MFHSDVSLAPILLRLLSLPRILSFAQRLRIGIRTTLLFSGTVSVEIVALLGTRTLALSKQTDPLLSFNYVEEVNLTSIEPSMGQLTAG